MVRASVRVMTLSTLTSAFLTRYMVRKSRFYPWPFNSVWQLK